MTTQEIHSEYPHVFDNEFNSRKIIGEIPSGIPTAIQRRSFLDVQGGAVVTDKALILTKDKSGKKEWVVFFKMIGNRYGSYGYSFINEYASRELNKIHLNLKINAKC
jgi:hypothetical protein